MPSDLHQHQVLRTFPGSPIEDTSRGLWAPGPSFRASPLLPVFASKTSFSPEPLLPASGHSHLLSCSTLFLRLCPRSHLQGSHAAPHCSLSVTPGLPWAASAPPQRALEAVCRPGLHHPRPLAQSLPLIGCFTDTHRTAGEWSSRPHTWLFDSQTRDLHYIYMGN